MTRCDPDFSAKNPGPHGTRLTSIIRLRPPAVDVSVLRNRAVKLSRSGLFRLSIAQENNTTRPAIKVGCRERLNRPIDELAK